MELGFLGGRPRLEPALPERPLEALITSEQPTGLPAAI